MDNGRANLRYTFHEVSGRGAWWDWFNQHSPILWVEDSKGFIATKDGEPVAGCVYDNWTANSVQVHLIILDPMVIRAGWLSLLAYQGFGKSRKYIYGLVPGNNLKALKLNKHLGYTEKCRLTEGFAPGVDYVVMELRREDCKFL